MARRLNSRASSARVQSTIRLITSLPTIRRTCIKNKKKKLTPSEYEQLLAIIENSKSLPDQLRFEYTRSTQQFEIRITTELHEGISAELNAHFALWRAELQKSHHSRISDAAETLRSHGHGKIRLPLPEEPEGSKSLDAKSPDGGIKHSCNLKCRYPALLWEVGFTNTGEELDQKAKDYIQRSKGRIRTVIVIYVGDIYKAEEKNERRLRKSYRTGEVDETGLSSYPTDPKNITAGASILVWRAKVNGDNIVTIGRVKEKKFRDTTGKPIRLASLRIPLEDCVCDSHIGLAKHPEIPPLEISSEAFCRVIELDLMAYRTDRAEVVRETVENERKKKADDEEKKQAEEERRQRATDVMAREDVGIRGLIRENSRIFSARIQGKISKRFR
ncbi:hypothetical protein F4859DRAFT_522939 [Xylaria cf. heliscus]|nr:hypothetical protein F4859DRAFT_522939 [Xylaria cf. heliscus]